MKFLVDELDGQNLDAAVAKALGNTEFGLGEFDDIPPKFSSEWVHGGPIIERERIALVCYGKAWDAAVDGFVDTEFGIASHTGEAMDAPTALVAAMRAFVTAELGGEVYL